MAVPSSLSAFLPRIGPGVPLAALAALGFATLGVWGKLAQRTGLDPFWALAWRFLIVAAVLLPLSGRGLSARQRLRALGIGAIYALATTLYFAGLSRISAGASSLLLYLAPAFVLLWGWLRGRAPARAHLLAVALAAAGLGLIVGLPSAADRDPLGLALAAAAGAGYAAYLLASERWLRGLPVLATTGHAALVCGVHFALYALATTGEWHVPETTAHWGIVLGMATVATLVAVPALQAAIARLGAARASLIATLEPVFAVALAAVVLGDPLRPALLVGGGLIVAGAVLAQREGKMGV